MIAALVIVAAVATTPATGKTEAVPLPIRLQDGATWTQTIAHTQTDERGGQTTSWTQTSENKAVFNHVEGAQTATVRQETLSASTSPGAPPAIVASAEFRFPVVMEVDPGLRPRRILNWTELQAAMSDFMPKIVQGEAQLAGARAQLQRMDERTAAGNLLRDLFLLGLGQGTRLEVGKELPYEDKLPNAMGGPPIATKASFHLESLDKRTGRAVIVWKQAMDPASAAASIKAAIDLAIARMPADQVEKGRAQLAGMAVNRADSCRYEVDVATGLAVKADCTSSVETGVPTQKARRTERWVMSQSLPEAR